MNLTENESGSESTHLQAEVLHEHVQVSVAALPIVVSTALVVLDASVSASGGEGVLAKNFLRLSVNKSFLIQAIGGGWGGD